MIGKPTLKCEVSSLLKPELYEAMNIFMNNCYNNVLICERY